MALRRLFVRSKEATPVLILAASSGKVIHSAPYSSEGSKHSSKKSGIKSKQFTKENRQTADDLLNEVSWKLHPSASARRTRWKTKEEINGYLTEIKHTTRFRKSGHLNDQSLSSTAAESKLHASDVLTKHVKSQANDDVDLNKVKRYSEILENTKDRLGIFDTVDKTKVETDEGPGYKTAVDWWDEFERKTRSRFDSLQPRNHYQEMLSWSEETKMPSFPINNEVGMEEEQNVPFYKHVFLHELIEDGFPKRGPIRKFMEVVILGLSKNPYLTVKEKEQHVQWFKEYFDEKLGALKHLGLTGEDEK